MMIAVRVDYASPAVEAEIVERIVSVLEDYKDKIPSLQLEIVIGPSLEEAKLFSKAFFKYVSEKESSTKTTLP
ncbi:MAG: hypothetical protein QW209_06535 [Nitrososphaerota archaeon]